MCLKKLKEADNNAFCCRTSKLNFFLYIYKFKNKNKKKNNQVLYLNKQQNNEKKNQRFISNYYTFI